MSAVTSDERLYQESQQIRNILPENVWIDVFNKLETTPDDLRNVCNATHLFRQLLFSKQKLFLGGITVDFVVSWMEPTNAEKKFISILDTIEKFKVNCISNCRAVCLSWCNGLDEQYTKCNSELYYYKEPYWSTATEFLNHFRNTHFPPSNFTRRRPYVLKHVYLLLDDEDFHTELPNLFNLIGSSITNLGFRILRNSFPTERSCYENLGDVLLKTSNLESLTLFDFLVDDDSLPQGMSEDFNARNLFVFKKLTHFMALRVPGIVFNRIIQTNITLSSMRLSCQRVSTTSFVNPFPCLKNLNVSQPDITEFRKYATQLSASPVKSLSIYFDLNLDFSVKWSNVFNLFPRRWSLTLSVLDLSLPQTGQSYFVEQAFQDSLNCRLRLPRVKELTISMPHAASLDFLLPLSKSLDHLKISKLNIRKYEELDDKIKTRLKFRQVVEHLDFINRMHESNIWNYFPKLMKLD